MVSDKFNKTSSFSFLILSPKNFTNNMKIHLALLFCLIHIGILNAQRSEPLLIVAQNSGKTPANWLTVNVPYFRELRVNAVWGLDQHFSADAELGYYFQNTDFRGDTVVTGSVFNTVAKPRYQRNGFTFTAGIRYYPLKTRIFYTCGGVEAGVERITLFAPTYIGNDGNWFFPKSYHILNETPHNTPTLGIKYGLGMNLRCQKLIGDMQIGASTRRVTYYDTDSDSTKKLLPFFFIDFRLGYIFDK